MGGDKYAAGQHRGIDVAVDDRASIRAPASGEVSFAGQVPTHGLTVTIVTGDGYKASLTHLGTLRVRKGALVAEGDPIADPGPSGDAEHAVPYVHLGIRVGEDAYVDPLGLLPPRSAPNPPPAPAAPPAPAPSPAPPPAPPPAAEQPRLRVLPLPRRPAAPAPTSPASETPAPPAVEPEPVVATPVVAVEATSRDGRELHCRSGGRARADRDLLRGRPSERWTRPRVVDAAETHDADGRTRCAETMPTRRRRAGVKLARTSSNAQRSCDRRPWSCRAPDLVRRRPVARDGARRRWCGRVDSGAGARFAADLGRGSARSCLGGSIVGRKVARGPLPIIDAHAVLRDDTDLLRELDAPYRARVHDDRCRHPGPALPATRRGHLLPDGRGRACVEGGARRGGARARTQGVRRPHRRRVARGATADRGHQ